MSKKFSSDGVVLKEKSFKVGKKDRVVKLCKYKDEYIIYVDKDVFKRTYNATFAVQEYNAI